MAESGKQRLVSRLKHKVHHHKNAGETDERCQARDFDFDEDSAVDRGAKNCVRERDLMRKLKENREAINKLDRIQRSCQEEERVAQESREVTKDSKKHRLKSKVVSKVKGPNSGKAANAAFAGTMKSILETGIEQPVKLHNGVVKIIKTPNSSIFDDVHDFLDEKLEKLAEVGPAPVGAVILPEDGIAYTSDNIKGKFYTDYSEKQDDDAVGVCFSGGGSRAMAAAQGQMLALHNAGLIDKVKYFSAVSGGSWAVACFCFRNAADKEHKDDDDYILGAKANKGEFSIPEDGFDRITIKDLHADMNRKALARGTTKSVLVKYVEQLATGSTVKSPKWFNVIKSIHLDRYNLGQPGPICLDDAHVDDLMQRTGNCIDKKQCCVVRNKRPYPIFNSCVIWPLGEDRVLSLFECTPLYTGVKPPRDISDRSDRFYGGGFVESAMFGARVPTKFHDKDSEFECEPFRQIYSLKEAVGTSSMALAQELSKLAELELALEYFVPTRDYWPLDKEHRSKLYEDQPFGDGGMVDNTGLLSMLQRHVPNIVIFSNHQTEPKIENGKLVLDNSVTRHFEGFHPKYNVQVFSEQTYEEMSSVFMECMKNGDPLVWHGEDVPVLENNGCGVTSHKIQKIVWVYLSKPQKFVDMLHPSVKDAIEGEPSKVDAGVAWLPSAVKNHLPLVNDVIADHFRDFPHYNTVSKLTLTNAEANLLTTLTYWSTREQVVPAIRNMIKHK